MANKGWIKLDRQITEHWLWQNHEYAFAWIDLLLLVNHENRKILVNNEIVTIKRGQTLTSIYKLAARWNWTRKKTYGFIKALEQDGMVRKNSTSRYTILSIVNYGKFQDSGSTKGTTKGPSTDTTEDTTKGLLQTLKQEYIKNDKEIEEEPAAPKYDEYGNDMTDPDYDWFEALEDDRDKE